jgi:hypothetical protein
METVKFTADDIDQPASPSPAGPVKFRAEDIDRAPDIATTTKQPAAEPTDPNTIGTFVRHFWQTVNPIQLGQLLPFPQALGGSGTAHPLAPANVVNSMQAVKQEGDTRWEKGDKVGAAAKYVESVIPFLGPMMSEWGNRLQRGEIAAVGGQVAGLLSPEAVSKLPAVSGTTRPLIRSQLNPAEAAAVQFGRAEGVPIDAATATGNRFVRGVQKLADESLGGSPIGATARRAQGEALTDVGTRLAERSRSVATTAEQAGQEVTATLESKVAAHHAFANTAYDKLRAIEAQAPAKAVVDLTGPKQALQPVYDQMRRQMPLTQQQANPGLKAIQNIIEGPDSAPLSQIDRDLSAIKAVARSQGGLAKFAVSKLDTAVQAAANRAGPQAIQSLQQGRAAIRAREATTEVLEALRAEPVQTFRQLTAPQDSAIGRLRTVAKEVPQAVPHIARAYLDNLLETATAEGGFARVDRLQAEWRKLGSETKQVLFPQAGQRQALDHFFLLAKRLGENPNPSGTAFTLWKGGELTALVTNPLVGVPYSAGTTALAKLLHSPAGVRALTQGLSLSVSPSKVTPAMRAAAVGSILKAIEETGAAPHEDESLPSPTSPQ